MRARTFIVRVSEAPPRVVVEDVRTERRVVAADLDAVGHQIAVWLRISEDEPTDEVAHARRGERSS